MTDHKNEVYKFYAVFYCLTRLVLK